MTWTSARPTTPGLYFYRDSGVPIMGAYVSCVEYHPEDLRVGFTNGWFGAVHAFTGQWAGPLEPPEEPPAPLTKEERGQIIREELNRG